MKISFSYLEIDFWKGQRKFIEALNILIEDYNNSNFQAIILDQIYEGKFIKKLLDLVQR